MIPISSQPLVLASASMSRAKLLAQAGLSVFCDASGLDEGAIKTAYLAQDRDATGCAEALAEAKARMVSIRHPGALVIGADQILQCEGEWYDKPTSLEEARSHLEKLRGREHVLVSAVCVVRDDALLWHHVDKPRLIMRDFTEGFLDDYLAMIGEGAFTSVGAYQLEGFGAQLFSRISGDYFSILGLPLLALLDFLRLQRVVRE